MVDLWGLSGSPQHPPARTLTSLTLIIVVSLQIFSVLNSDDAAAPALETQPQGDEEGEPGAGIAQFGLGRSVRDGAELGSGASHPVRAPFSKECNMPDTEMTT